MMFFRSNQSPSPVRIVRQSCQQAGGGGSTQDYVKLRRRFVPEPARGSLARDGRLSRGGRATGGGGSTGSAQRAAAAAEISAQTNERRSESSTTNFQLAGLFISRIATGLWSAIQTQASIDSLKSSCIVTPARASLLLFILCCLSGSFIEALQRHDAQTDCVTTTSTSTTLHRHDQQWGSSPADRDHLSPQNVASSKRDIVLKRNQKRNQNQQPSFNSDLDLQQQSVEMGEQVNDERASSGALAEQPTSQLPAASSTQEFPLPSGQDNLFATYSHGLDVPLRSQQAASMLTLAVVAPASSMESNSDSNDNNNNNSSNSNSNSNNNNNNENGSYRHRFYRFYHHNYRPSALLLERQLEETDNGADDETRRRARPPAEANEPNEKRATTSRANDLESSASASVPTRQNQAQVADKSDSPRTPDAAPAAAAAAAAARRPLTSGQRRRRRRRRRPDQRAAVGGEQTSPAASDTITAHRMRAAARLTSVSRATPAVASSRAVARGESQWIPIVTSDQRRNNRISRLVDTTTTTTTSTAAATGAQVTSANHGQASSSVAQAASNQAASTLLDFRSPVALSEPLLAQNGHQPRPPSRQDGGGQAPPPAAGNQQPQQQQRARERQQAAGSRVHGNRHRHQHAYTPPYYNQLQLQQQQPAPHWHRRPRQHQHQQQQQRQRPARHHRRPRLNSNHETDGLEQEAPEFRPSKVYKRVLLCDKTLVSLDYIRHLEAEPRPSAEQFLSELEINEISDNFISDLDGAYEILARSAASPAGEQSRPNSTTIDLSQQQPPLSGNASASGLPEPLEGNGSNRAGLLLSLERRLYGGGGAARALLSDADPLVRCDMWDLEKGLKSRKPPEAILRAALKADFDTVRDAINRCRQLSERTLPPDEEPRDGLEMLSTEDLASLFSMKRGLIPGTKWCGLGDQASSYNDLGPKHRIDICCRAHDHCPIRSKPFRNDYGVLNIGLYTKSHCDCDADFYRCLRGVRSRTADMLGNLYFNVMKLQCMREERLKVCREMKPIALGFERCIRYEPSPSKTVFKFTTPPVAY